MFNNDERNRAGNPGIPDADLSDRELVLRAELESDTQAFPETVLHRLLGGVSPVKVFREYRGIKQKDLAARIDITPVYLSQIETGRRRGGTKTLIALARELEVTVDDLI